MFAYIDLDDDMSSDEGVTFWTRQVRREARKERNRQWQLKHGSRRKPRNRLSKRARIELTLTNQLQWTATRILYTASAFRFSGERLSGANREELAAQFIRCGALGKTHRRGSLILDDELDLVMQAMSKNESEGKLVLRRDGDELYVHSETLAIRDDYHPIENVCRNLGNMRSASRQLVAA